METLIYQTTPIVHLASNTFVNVPIILQHDETPLIQVVKVVDAGFTTEIPIYNSDGIYLAKVVGSQLFSTPEGEKAGVTLRHPDKLTVCEIGGKTVFELTRKDAASLKTTAELYTGDGSFVKCSDSDLAGYVIGEGHSHLQIKGIHMTNCSFQGCRIGIWIQKNGGVAIGVNR